MIDESDGDFALLASMGGGGLFAIALTILAIVFYIAASQNEKECAGAKCPPGQTGELLDHQCLCVAKPESK